jgi:hypothetical protein
MKDKNLLSSFLPTFTFIFVLGAHNINFVHFPTPNELFATWDSVRGIAPTRELLYQLDGHFWLGYTYAISAAFAVWSLCSYFEERSLRARNAAAGGVAATGFLAAFACFMVGCCGSPMLAVWLGVFGASVLPFTKIIIAGITTVSVLLAFWWLKKRQSCDCEGSSCS